MPVTIVKKTKTNETPYQRWYRKNKEKFNAERRKRYAEDEDYRERMKQFSADTRERAKESAIGA